MNNENISDFYDVKWVLCFNYILDSWISAKMTSKKLMFIKVKAHQKLQFQKWIILKLMRGFFRASSQHRAHFRIYIYIIINRRLKYVTSSKVVAQWCSWKKAVVKNFGKLKGKHLQWSPFLVKVQAFTENLLTVSSAYSRHFSFVNAVHDFVCIFLIHLPTWRKYNLKTPEVTIVSF